MMYCKIVWDGENFKVPEEMGKPREDQMSSTPLDNLTELAGRVCYDSCGTGRNSIEYHKHIIEVGHRSVQEHANLTFLIPNLSIPDYLSCCEAVLNRPGIWVAKKPKQLLTPPFGMGFDLRITTNLRAIAEWFRYPLMNKWSTLLGETLQNLAKEKAPLTLCNLSHHDIGQHNCKVVEPETDEEIWISMFITNVSRGCTHELVRHGDWTGISQRSTRFIDESNSSWIWHPLFAKYFDHIKDPNAIVPLNDAEHLCKSTYEHYAKALQEFLVGKGLDKFMARKQCRGAVRGILGNALMTELVFSASLSQWKWMIKLRSSRHSDGEIRLLFNGIYQLLSSKYDDRFKSWKKADCLDGMGYEVYED